MTQATHNKIKITRHTCKHFVPHICELGTPGKIVTRFVGRSVRIYNNNMTISYLAIVIP